MKFSLMKIEITESWKLIILEIYLFKSGTINLKEKKLRGVLFKGLLPGGPEVRYWI